MLDSMLLGAGGLLATAVILTEPFILTRLMVALSFGVLVCLYFWVALPYHQDGRQKLNVELLDIFD